MQTWDHFTYYCLGSQGGKLWVAMRLLGPIACRKVCRNTAETRKTISLSFWIVGFQFQLFLQTIGLDAATSSPLTGLRSIVLPLELNVRVEMKQLAIADAGGAAAAAQSEGETSSRRACGSRKADRGTQETWGRNGASTCLLECENSSSKVALSHTLFWERERKRRLAEAFISGLTLSVVQWEALWKALGIELKEKVLSQMCAANEERGRKNVRGAGRLPVVTLEDQLLVMTVFEDQARVAAAGAGIHFWCVGSLCVTRLSRSGLVSCTWGWDDFRRGHLGRIWRHPWQSASVWTTLTHLLSWMPQELCTKIRSCLALQSQLYSCYKSRTTLKDLIGISLNGSIYFVSELWSGPISDRELVIKSVMFCLSKKFLSSHSQAVLPFNFFFNFLTSFICCLLIRRIASQASCFVFQKKILIIAFTSIVLFQSPFFSNFFRVCWFGWLIHEHHVFF